MVIIGIDPHKSSFTAVAVGRSGVTVGSRRFVVNAGTATALVKWCQRWPERQYAIEGAKGLGRGIAQILVARGEDVVDVPSTLANESPGPEHRRRTQNRPRRCPGPSR